MVFRRHGFGVERFHKTAIYIFYRFHSRCCFQFGFPRHRPASKPKQAALLALVATPPSLLACWAVYYAVTREWAHGFLPDAPFVAFPLPVALVTSLSFVLLLVSVWVCQRKPLAEVPQGETSCVNPK